MPRPDEILKLDLLDPRKEPSDEFMESVMELVI